MTPDVWTFYLPKPPDIANGRTSVFAAVREKRKYWEQLRTRMDIKHGFPARPPAPIARAELALVWHFTLPQHRPDPDNAIRRLKSAIDFLVANGFLAGDSPDHVTWVSPTYCHGLEGLPPLTTVRLTITPLPTIPQE